VLNQNELTRVHRFAGTSGESSSYRYGLFDCTITGIEIILGCGQIVNACKTSRRDLFFAAAGSCGSLGVITRLKMELIDALPYVELEYIPVNSTNKAYKQFQCFQDDPRVHYMDGIM
jgi:delta24-sterol reductase